MTHAFEIVGLGIGPFEFLEVDHFPEGDKCEYCGTRIVNRFWIEGACGTKFTVGSECVKKVDKTLSKECARALKQFKLDQAMSEEEKEFYAGFESVG